MIQSVCSALTLLCILTFVHSDTCMNTYSGLTKCAILNGETTNKDTVAITRHLVHFIDGWYTQQVNDGMSGSIVCMAAFDTFHCVFVVNTMYGGSPCDSTGEPLEL